MVHRGSKIKGSSDIETLDPSKAFCWPLGMSLSGPFGVPGCSDVNCSSHLQHLDLFQALIWRLLWHLAVASGALWVSSESKVKCSNSTAMLESSEHLSGGLSRPLGMSGGGLSESPIFDASNNHLMDGFHRYENQVLEPQ